ncbi:hypothetical protein [Qipengyuania nanhaisediminis]|uniref:hypothetical protein n=1 Tax=Qipengyuania nanhaisediminis TaxID=604088 RepID=UPI0038B33327
MKLERSYTSNHEIDADGTVRFACSRDCGEWPWLALGPHHPVALQAQNFWASVGAANALGSMSEGQWSALTWTEWQCGAPRVGDAARGTYRREVSGDSDNFVIALFDEADREIVTMRGRGVVFRNRNFEQWREEAKRKAAASAPAKAPPAPSEMASRAALGLGQGEHPLIAPSTDNGGENGEDFIGIVTPENAMPPNNRVLSGSGDHVNTVHMVEAARQALCLATGDPRPAIGGGEMTLKRYVELGTPFTLSLSHGEAGETRFTLDQLGRECAAMVLRQTP